MYLQIESYDPRKDDDDTALNDITLICAQPSKWTDIQRHIYELRPSFDSWGSWKTEIMCPEGRFPFFLSAFKLQVEAYQVCSCIIVEVYR